MASIAEKNRIGKMIAALKKAGTGKYSVALDVSSKKDEIDMLADAINKTLKKIVKQGTGKRKVKAGSEITKERNRNILDSIQESYFETDLKGNLLFFNDAVMKDLGYTAEDLAGKNFQQLVDKENSKKVYDIFHQVFLTGEPTKGFDWQILKKDKSILDVESSVTLRRDEKGNPKGFRGIVRDVTPRKQAEKSCSKVKRDTALFWIPWGKHILKLTSRGKPLL